MQGVNDISNLDEFLKAHPDMTVSGVFTRSLNTLTTNEHCWQLDQDAHTYWSKRCRHYFEWSTANQTKSTFEHYVFDDELPHLSVSRTVTITPLSPDASNVTIDSIKPLSEGVFSNQLDKTLLNAMNDVVLVSEPEPFDRPGPRVVYANRAFENDTGYTSAEIIGKTPRILQHSMTSEASKANIRRALNAWKPVTQVVCNKKKNGEIFYSELVINPVSDKTGWYTHWVAVQRDITEKYLKEINKTNILEAFPEATLSLNANKQITYFSSNAEMLFEQPKQVVLGQNVATLLPDSFIRYIDHAFLQQEVIQYTEHFPLRVNATTKYCTVHMALMDSEGLSQSITLFIKDITEQKAKDEEIKIAREVNLKQSRLASMGELAAGVGHEINNPLQIISGQLEILSLKLQNKTNSSSEAIVQHLQQIDNAAERIGRIVRGLKKMSRVNNSESGAESDNIALTCVQTVEMMQELLGKKGVQIIYRCDDNELKAMIDAISVQQILVNLINNASDAMANSPEKQITVSLEAIEDRCVLCVSDTGQGIAREHQDHIFEAFFTTKKVGEGTGLGLSVIHSIIKSFAGEIDFFSTNSGTTFRVSLPRTQASNSVQPESCHQPTSNKTVLLVDDEPAIIEVLEICLKQTGNIVHSAMSPADAVRLFNTHPIDIVITDFQMPDMTGEELLMQLKKLKRNTGFTSIMMTGNVSYGHLQGQDESSNAIWDKVLSKPFTIPELIDCISE